jgi:hypothetical protein
MVNFCVQKTNFNTPSTHISAMFALIATSIAIGYFMENGYKFVAAKYINNWSNLLSIILFLYLLIFSQLYALKIYRDQVDSVSLELLKVHI